jgi:hypothetical protein
LANDWTAIALVLAAVSTACAGTCGVLLLRFRRSASARQHELVRHMDALRDMVQILEARVAEEDAALADADETSQAEPSPDAGVVTRLEAEASPDENTLTSEMQAVIATAAVVRLGPSARVNSVRLLSSPHASPWSQQGRMLVQASHNVRQGTRPEGRNSE